LKKQFYRSKKEPRFFSNSYFGQLFTNMNLRRLALLAKLSPSAVSLALRDSPKISAATKKRVHALASRLGYKADAQVVEMMRHLRKPASVRQTACFGVISFYDQPRPWERSLHLTRIYEGMRKRADQLGYRLEPLWLRAPGMTYQRFKGILEARGIEGLLCFGSPDLDQEFPEEFNRCAIVTLGLSIRTPLHRVISHAYNDTVEALNRLHRLGYRRPGLVLGQYEELRSAHAHSAAYLGWCEHRLGLDQTLPILRLDQVEPRPLLSWLKRQRPDAVVFVHLHDVLTDLKRVLRKNRVRVPEDLGISAISPVLDDTGFAGLQENQELMGTWAVELLASRITNRDTGIPVHPRIEMIESLWVDDRSLRRIPSTVD
jgi:LacI family transcriptional regulator